jgi:hypothetical protein
MRYLKKYNESFENDLEYIKNCFIDIIDSGAKMRSDDSLVMQGGYICSISIELPIPRFEGDAMSVKEFMEYNTKLNKIYEDIDYSVEKVNLKLDYNSFIELSETSNLTNTSYDEVFTYFTDIYVVFMKKEEE